MLEDKMKFALFIIEQGSSDEDNKLWRDFSYNTKCKMANISGLTMLNQGTYLLNLSNGLQSLSTLVAEAKLWKISSRTLFFESDPSFIIS